jgi:hypothetical protein
MRLGTRVGLAALCRYPSNVALLDSLHKVSKTTRLVDRRIFTPLVVNPFAFHSNPK